MCHTLLSIPLANTSRRPSALHPTVSRPSWIVPPRLVQPVHPVAVGVGDSLMQRREPSLQRANTVSSPFRFCPTAKLSVMVPASEAQLLHPLLGAVCQMCQS